MQRWELSAFDRKHLALVSVPRPARLELLKETVPSLSRVAVLHLENPQSLTQLRDTKAAASVLRLTVVPVRTTGPGPKGIDEVFANDQKGTCGGPECPAWSGGRSRSPRSGPCGQEPNRGGRYRAALTVPQRRRDSRGFSTPAGSRATVSWLRW
jgi:hypothetical protein